MRRHFGRAILSRSRPARRKVFEAALIRIANAGSYVVQKCNDAAFHVFELCACGETIPSQTSVSRHAWPAPLWQETILCALVIQIRAFRVIICNQSSSGFKALQAASRPRGGYI
jgi:hypothetical protein